VSTGHDIDLMPPVESREHNWVALIIAAAAVLIAAALVILTLQHAHKAPVVTPVSAALDAYAPNLPITGLVMSESANLAGSKVTYVDGHIANKGNRTVTGITVQVLFRDVAREVTQNQTMPLMLIRVRDPYVDVEPVGAAPLKPGDEHDFRLIFDSVSPDWDGAYPQIRIIHVDKQ
jgi:Protein of unknown function (DUF2393)